MRLRLWLALPIGAVALLAWPAVSYASVGVGVQAGPVRLDGSARPGGQYALPPLYVVNTGTEAESVSISVERISAGTGKTVPPGWISASSAPVQLSRAQSARIPLELTVPRTAAAGRYFSDVVANGSASLSAGGANLGVAAATSLEFSVAPGAASPGWFSAPGWLLPYVLGVLVLGAAAVGIRRSGIRIRVERAPSRPSPRSGSGGGGSAAMSRHARWLLPVLLTAVTGCGVMTAPQQATGQSGRVNVSLTTVRTIRAVTISPGQASFSHCTGGDGGANTRSTSGRLGFPNGTCWVGSNVSGSYPITVTNTGIGSDIDISGTSAAPSDGGNTWNLCSAGGDAAVGCTGHKDKPGPDQYQVLNFSSWGTRSGGIGSTPRCDRVFGPGGSCWAVEDMVVTEGLELVGPQWSSDTSTKWTVTIIWTPVPGRQN